MSNMHNRKKVFWSSLLLFVLFALSFAYWVTADVSSTSVKVTHTCDGSTTGFAFTFPIIDTSDLVVILRNTTTGIETTLTETTDYSLSATNNDYSSGGTVTTVDTYASGQTLTLIRETPLTQGATFSDTGVLRLAALEDAYDKLTLLVQQNQETIDRCIKLPRSEDLDTELDSSVSRADKYLYFDATTGAPSTSTTLNDADNATVSAYMETILDDANEAEFKATVNLEAGTDIQAYDAGLLSIAGLTTAADKMIYTSALDTYATTSLTSTARSLLDDATAAAMQTTLGLSNDANLGTATTYPSTQNAVKTYVDSIATFFDANGSTVFATTMTAANTWQDLDLSSYVGSNTALVFLEVKASGSDVYAVKPKGYGSSTFTAHWHSSLGPFGDSGLNFEAANDYGYVTSVTDSSGVIQHGAATNTVTFTIKLVGFLK